MATFTHFSWWGLGRSDAPGYRPLVTLSFALDNAMVGLTPSWFHAVNFTWHAVVSMLVYALALRLGMSRKASLCGALAFCVLPVHSEAVIWSVGRAELMAAAGFTASLLLLLEYRDSGKLRHAAGAAVLFAAALFSKENPATLLAAPAAATLILPTTRSARKRDAIATAVLLAVLLAYFGVRSLGGPVIGSAAGDRLDNPLSVLTGVERILGALSVLGRYLALSVWPHPLSIDYSYDALAIDHGFRGDRYTVLAVGACVGMAYAALRVRRRMPAVTYALVLAAMTYSIVSNTILLIGTAMAERLFYLPSLGLCLAIAPALVAVGERRGGKGYVVLGTLGAACAAVVFARALDWQSPVSIFEAAARAYPRSARAQMEVASAYGHAGRTDEAVAAFERATAIMPDYAAAWYNLGNLRARNGRYSDAEAAYRTALRYAPRLNSARYNLAIVLTSLGRTSEAVDILRPGLEFAPDDPVLAMTLADSYLSLGRNREAADTYEHVLRIDPASSGARLRRALALERASGCEAALPDYLAVLQQQPGEPTALGRAVTCLQASGQQSRARELLERARVANQGAGR